MTEINKIDLTLSPKEQKKQREFYKESIHFVFNLQYSGVVLFGGPLYTYLNEVKSNLLSGNPELAKRITVYPIKSSSLNAFATQGGNIYVNIGLLARIKTEDEIAYVLAHEIAHYKEKHNMKGYIRTRSRTSNAAKDDVRETYGDSIIKLHNYSQVLEFQADTIGLGLLKKSKYKTGAAVNALKELKYSELMPILGIDLGGEFVFDLLSNVSEVLPNVSGKLINKEQSSHPAISQRIEKMQSLIPGPVDTTSLEGYKPNQYLNECLYLLLQTYLENGEYPEALYMATVLKKKAHNEKDYQCADLVSLKAFHSLTLLSHKNKIYFNLVLNNSIEQDDPSVRKLAIWMKSTLAEEQMAIMDLHLLMDIKKNNPGLSGIEPVEKSCLRMLREYYPDMYAEIEKKEYSDIFKNITEKDRPIYQKYFPVIDSTILSKDLSGVLNVSFKQEQKINRGDFEIGHVLIMPSKNFLFKIPFWHQDYVFNSDKSDRINARSDILTYKAITSKGNKVMSPYLKGVFSTDQYNFSHEVSLMLRDIVVFEDFYSNVDVVAVQQEMKAQNLRYINNTYSIVFKESAVLDGFFETVIGIAIWPLLYPGIRHLACGDRYQTIYSVAIDVEKERIIEYEINTSKSISNKNPQRRIKRHQKKLAKAMNQ